ncbi:MAG: tetraacyldisaccharide 4'-kinase [Syntrophaceae bacterium]|nr:tetraacyldisaccharide 4'-kinase [Syntrophaceae bacterium]
MMKKIINWQRIWDDDGKISFFTPVKIIAGILSFFYLFIIKFRNWLYNHKIFKEIKLSCPVISVGNISVGGTGKTPCVIMLAQILKKNGFHPAVISRGYGGSSKIPYNIVSDGKKILLNSEIAGDEPSLIAHALKGVPVIIGPERKITGQIAIDKFGADVLICDDAMQHRQIFRDVNLVLLDSKGFRGNYHVLPRGKLREPIGELRRADAVLYTHADEGVSADEKVEELIRKKNIPVFQSIHKPEDIISGDGSVRKPIAKLKGKKVNVFCGIANSDSFKKTVMSSGSKILSLDVFPDHHRYSGKEIKKLMDVFRKSEADYLVTTGKDAVRLQDNSGFLKLLSILRVKMEIEPSARLFEKFIMDKIKPRHKK